MCCATALITVIESFPSFSSCSAVWPSACVSTCRVLECGGNCTPNTCHNPGESTSWRNNGTKVMTRTYAHPHYHSKVWDVVEHFASLASELRLMKKQVLNPARGTRVSKTGESLTQLSTKHQEYKSLTLQSKHEYDMNSCILFHPRKQKRNWLKYKAANS